MRRTLPICPLWFRPAIAILCGWFAGALGHADEVTGGYTEAELEVFKQLAFVQQHLAEDGVIDGIESPYDVKVSPDGGHVYVASQRNDAISYFVRNAEDGELTYGGSIGATQIGTAALDGARSLALSPDGEYVYAVSMFADTLVVFNRTVSTGELQYLATITDGVGGVDGLQGARSVVVSPDGKNLYVAAYDDSKVSVFSLNSATGAASFLGVYSEGDQGVEELSNPHAVAISPDGKHVYVALWKNEVVVFSRDVSTGLLSYGSKLKYLVAQNGTGSAGTHRAMAMSPDGKFVYLSSWNTDSVTVFSRNSESGELAIVSNAFNGKGSVKKMDGPHALSISQDGNFIYVAAFSSDSVTSFERDSETGAITYYQSINAESGDEWDMNGPISIGTSPDGEHVYVGSGSGTHSLVTFRREILVDPPELVVDPVDTSIEEGESVAFHALAQGLEIEYQWLRDGEAVVGATLPVLSLEAVSAADDGSQFRIQVRNDGGILTSDFVTLTVLPPVVVGAPVDLTALDISSASARLLWSDESDNETGFEVQRREPGGEFSTVATVLENGVQYDDNTLSASTTYIYRVRAKRGENVSLWSNDAVIESFDDVPQAPVNLNVVEQAYNRVSLRWADRSAVEDGFRIFRRTDEIGGVWSSIASVGKNVTTYVDRTAEAQSTYAYRVYAYNESGTSDFSNSVVAITSTIPVDSISPTSRSIPRDAVSGYSIGVTSTKAWEAVSSVDWLVVTSPTGGVGSGNQGVTYRSRINESQSERSGTIVVGGIEHTVLQAGSPPFLRVAPSLSEVGAEGGSVLVDVESNVDWTTSESADWVSITSGQSGSDYGTVIFLVEENTSFDERIAQVTINSVTHTIEQAGKIPVLELEAEESRFAASGGDSSLSVTSNTDWSASVSVSWISLSGVTAGDADGVVVFAVGENDTGETRSADILVNDKAVTITQDAWPVVVSSIDPESRVIAAEAMEGYLVGVVSTQDWSAVSDVDWLVVTSPEDGMGSGSQDVVYRALGNESEEERTGRILVGGLEHTVVQGGFVPFLTIVSGTEEIAASGGSVFVGIEANVDWAASEEVDWVSVVSGQAGSGDGTIELLVDSNASIASRVFTLTVNSQTVEIGQAAAVPVLEVESDRSRFAADGGEAAVLVTSNIDWSASVSASWISLGDQTSGDSDGVVAFEVEANDSGEVREASILVNEKTVMIMQDAPFVSELETPEWVGVTVGPLGAELEWSDLSDSEVGFRIRRSVVGSGRIFEVADLAADVTSYFDRDAPRGKVVEYSLVAYDAMGETEAVFATSAELPSANMTKLALRVEAQDWTEAFVSEISLAGDGEVSLSRESFGDAFGKLVLSGKHRSGRYALDSDAGQMRRVGTAQLSDWASVFSFEDVVGAGAFSSVANGVLYAARSEDGGSAFSRGARVLGQLLGEASVIVVGFEIEGEIELPILLQAVGKGLEKKQVSGVVEDLRLRLYRLDEAGEPSLLAENADWAAGSNTSTVSLEDAIMQTGAIATLSADGGEARLQLMLGVGRYVAVLSSVSGQSGSAMLEVLDAR